MNPLNSPRNNENQDIELKHSRYNAFTVIELIIILTVISILVTLAVPEVLDARRNARSLACGVALNQIEAAKSAWAREFPGAPIGSTNDLLRYFPGGKLPADPWRQQFIGVTDLSVVTSHPFNGNPVYEPAGASPSTIMSNGHNDTGKPTMQ
jgi:type II secretory pathway pseudopilin PulG